MCFWPKRVILKYCRSPTLVPLAESSQRSVGAALASCRAWLCIDPAGKGALAPFASSPPSAEAPAALRSAFLLTNGFQMRLKCLSWVWWFLGQNSSSSVSAGLGCPWEGWFLAAPVPCRSGPWLHAVAAGTGTLGFAWGKWKTRLCGREGMEKRTCPAGGNAPAHTSLPEHVRT